MDGTLSCEVGSGSVDVLGSVFIGVIDIDVDSDMDSLLAIFCSFGTVDVSASSYGLYFEMNERRRGPGRSCALWAAGLRAPGVPCVWGQWGQGGGTVRGK
jgi:hypothetical protein